MFEYGEKHPVLFEIVLFAVAFSAALVFVVTGVVLNMHPDLASSVGRTLVGLGLFIVFRKMFKLGRFLNNLWIVLPALLFPAWNIFYYMSSGIAFGGVNFWIEGAITAIAPAIFEEVIFRGIFIYNLRENGKNDLQCLFISSIMFSLVHLTNLAGQDLAIVLLQTGYALAIGMLLAAIYLKNGSLLQVLTVHFLIDISDKVFVSKPTSASFIHWTIFVSLIIAAIVYAVRLIDIKQKVEELSMLN